jgi:hypothetical protein
MRESMQRVKMAADLQSAISRAGTGAPAPVCPNL